MFDFWQAPDLNIWCGVTLSTSSIWRNSVLCFDDFVLLKRKDSAQMTILGHWGYGVQFGVFHEGTEVRSQLFAKDLFWERTHWTSQEDCDTYARERWPQTLQRRPRDIWGGSVWFDSAHQVSKLCDNFLLSGALTFIMMPLHQSWTSWVRSVSSCYSHIPTPGWSVNCTFWVSLNWLLLLVIFLMWD